MGGVDDVGLCGHLPQFLKTGTVADGHKGRHRLSLGIIPENIQNLREHHEESPRKSTRRLSQETGISRKTVLRIIHDDLKLFPYKIQISQRQTDLNKAEWETFYEDISQRIENNPGLLDLNDLNDVDHCGLCGTSATLAVSQNLATKHWIIFLSGTLFLPKSLLHCCCQKNWFCGKVCLNDFYPLLRSKSSSWIHIGVKRISQACCLHHLKNMENTCKTQLWDGKQNRVLFLDHPVYGSV